MDMGLAVAVGTFRYALVSTENRKSIGILVGKMSTEPNWTVLMKALIGAAIDGLALCLFSLIRQKCNKIII